MAKGPLVLIVFLILASGAIAIMVAVALSSLGAPLEQSALQAKGYALRRWWFIGLTLCLAIIFAVTVPWFPYAHPHGSSSTRGAALRVKIIAQQYGFTMPSVLPLNRPILFDVTSLDVNHGFGIYGPQDQLIAQVQAMPDYTNHLPVVFTRPGHYTVRCLEYCGIGHAYMRGGFDVR